MTVTDADIQSILVDEVGDEVTEKYPSGILATNVALYWASYADKAQIGPRLQELYTKRRCVDAVLGIVRKLVDFEIHNDHRRSQSQKAKALEAMRDDCQAEIDTIEKKTRSNRGGAAGLITTVTPQSPPNTAWPDANDSRFQGDPYKRTLNRSE